MPGRPDNFKLGQMRHRITVSQPTESIDSAGQPICSWTSVVENEPAQFIPTGGVESMRGRQLEAGTKAIFRVRYRNLYNTQMKVTYNGTDYGITYVNDDGFRRYTELVCVS